MANPNSEMLNKADSSAHDFKNRMMSSENQLEKLSHDAGKKVGALASELANTTTDYVKTSRDYIRENPAKGAALAVAIGAITGSLITMLLSGRKN